MVVLHHFEVMLNDKQILHLTTSADRSSVFFLSWILENSESVLQFKVSQGIDGILSTSTFGFGEMHKWVQKFDWSRQ